MSNRESAQAQGLRQESGVPRDTDIESISRQIAELVRIMHDALPEMLHQEPEENERARKLFVLHRALERESGELEKAIMVGLDKT